MIKGDDEIMKSKLPLEQQNVGVSYNVDW